MDFNNLFQSRGLRLAVFILTGFALVLMIFGAGMYIGFRKASFSYNWGDNYFRNFGGPRNNFPGDFRGRGYFGGHSGLGDVIAIEGNALTVVDQDNVEKSVIIGEDTVIRKLTEEISLEDIKVGDRVTVIGQPNSSGQIEAKLVRVMPQMPSPMLGR